MVMRPMSISPIVNRIMSGATSANSTSAAPLRPLDPNDRLGCVDRTHLMPIRLDCFHLDVIMPDRIERLETISQAQRANKWSHSKCESSHQPRHFEQ